MCRQILWKQRGAQIYDCNRDVMSRDISLCATESLATVESGDEEFERLILKCLTMILSKKNTLKVFTVIYKSACHWHMSRYLGPWNRMEDPMITLHN